MTIREMEAIRLSAIRRQDRQTKAQKARAKRLDAWIKRASG